jgi:hypothetical protein
MEDHCMTLSNELTASAFFTNPEIPVTQSRTPDIPFPWWNSPKIALDTVGTSDTRAVGAASALALLPIPRDTQIGRLRLQSILLVQLRQTPEGVLAETWLEGVYEYGAGQDDSEAVIDLIASLGEYVDALEARELQLGDSAKHELYALRRLVTRDI